MNREKSQFMIKIFIEIHAAVGERKRTKEIIIMLIIFDRLRFVRRPVQATFSRNAFLTN